MEKIQILLRKLGYKEDSLATLGLRLLSALYQSHETVVFSPASIFVTLCSILNGAGSDTAVQIKHLLGLDSSDLQSINEFCGAFSTQFLANNRNAQLGVPNAIWLSKHMTALPVFAEACQRFYGGNLHICDFSEATKTAAAINGWAEKETQGLIVDVQIPFGASTDLLVTSSVYLKALWKSPFVSTHKSIFHTAQQTRVEVDMMSVRETLRFSQSPDFRAVQLPFRDANLHMIIALPAPNVSFQQLFFPHPRIFDDANYKIAPVHLELPRFDVSRRLDLKGWLVTLGITDLLDFNPSCDLNKLAFPKAYLNAARHDARLKIDQLGSEAGATSIASKWGGGVPPNNQLVINRPFFFAVVDTLFQQILYMGVVANPLRSAT